MRETRSPGGDGRMGIGDFARLADRMVEAAEGRGLRYYEVRVQIDESSILWMRNGVLEAFGMESSAGGSVRVISNGRMGFASTNDAETGAEVVEEAVAGAAGGGGRTRLSREEPVRDSYSSRVVRDPRDVPLDEKIEFLRQIDERMAEMGITARSLMLEDSRQVVLIRTSEGLEVRGDVTRISSTATLTLVDGARSTQDRVSRGGSGGWEILSGWGLLAELEGMAESMKERLEKGVPAPRGKMDVVIGPSVSGLVAHESTGHPYEADRVLGREAAQAGESFVRPDMLGERIGSEVVSVVDDPTLEGSYGFYLYDWEGVRARPRFLMKEGLINEFLHNRETASVFGVRSNAAARASRYDREPIVRMANTYIAPGDETPEELIEGVSEGVYMKRFMEWNIDDRRFNQRYVGSEAYLIRGGRLAGPVLRPVLEVTTPGFYSSVDGIGRDLEFEAATCGKGAPGQGVPVWTGGPTLRLRGVGLGGR